MASNRYGWIPPTPSQRFAVMSSLPMPVFADVHDDVKGSGAGKRVLLYEFLKKLHGSYIGQTQGIGDCVSFGTAHAVDYTYATEIVVGKQPEEWVTLTSTEDIYGGSRVQIGKGRLGSGDGSIGAWAAQYVSQYGTLLRQKYGSIDLTKYDSNRAYNWGLPKNGTPSILLPEARKHTIKTVSLVSTYEEVRDAIANGYAVTICSNQGFSKTRDQDGYCSPRGSWAHCMCIIGVDDESRRKGAFILNSWGPSYFSGPVGFNAPKEGFWCDANVLEDRILSSQDCWSFSDRVGYPRKKINLRIV